MSSDPETAARTSPATLFLSYARADRPTADKLADLLTKAGHTVWWDALIEGGAQFASSIREALEAADVVIVLWSKNSIDSDWVRDEAAQGRDRRRLVPLSIDGTKAPLGFRQYQLIDLSRWKGRADTPQFDAILRAVATALGQKAPARRTRTTPMSRRQALAAGTGTAAVLAGGGAWVAWQTGIWGPSNITPRSIAVLPFKNLSGDPAQDYFSDGLTEEVRAALAANPGLQVLAATSSNTARARTEDAETIARKLGVAYLLEGSVQRSNDVVRISANLTNGKTGFSEWSQRVDRRLSDIFAVQNEIARLVANALQVRVATARPATGGTANVRAYEDFLRGRALFNLAKDEETDRAALAHFDLAISADPGFAMAHAARSRSLASIAAEYARAEELQPLYAASIAAARRSLELAPDLAEANLALGYVLYAGKLDFEGARPYFDKAYRLGRGNADIILLFALYCSRAGRADEARSAIARAIALDPLNPRTHRAAGSIDYAARRYEDALAPLERALQLNPEISNARALMGHSLMQLGRLNEARAAFEAEPNTMFRLTGLAIINHRLGDLGAARRNFAQLVAEMGDSALYQQAEVLAQWGLAGDAIAALNKARAVGDSGLIYVSTDPLLDPIRKEPGFSKFLREMRAA